MADVLLITLLILCFYQDVRYRGIHWVLFPALLAACIYKVNAGIDGMQIAYNLLYITFMMGMIVVYLFFRNGKLTSPTNGYFAWGDILFLLAITPLFSFQSFMLFFTIGTCVALITHVVMSMVKVQKSVPYAGYMAAFGVGYLFLEEGLIQWSTMTV